MISPLPPPFPTPLGAPARPKPEPPAIGTAATAAAIVDRMETSVSGPTGAATPDASHAGPARPQFNHLEAAARYSADLLVHLGLSDTPNVVSVVANIVPLPLPLRILVDLSNLANTLTGLPALATDVREVRDEQRNPLATRTDRVMDVTHLLAGDALSTLGSLIPFVCSMSNPIALGLFVGTQALGLALDVAKTAYDMHRQGQQSAWREGQEAVKAGSSQTGP